MRAYVCLVVRVCVRARTFKEEKLREKRGKIHIFHCFILYLHAHIT